VRRWIDWAVSYVGVPFVIGLVSIIVISDVAMVVRWLW
jgi:hypothetical protein